MSLRDQNSLRRKLVHVIMLSVGLALVLALTAFLALETHSYRESAERDLRILAEMLGEGSGEILRTQDPREASRHLSSLRVQKFIVEAALVDSTGHVLAHYRRNGVPAPSFPKADLFASEPGTMVVSRTIHQGDKPAGTLHLRSDMRELNLRVRWVLAGGLLLTLLIGFTTWLLASRLSRLVTDPILRLAQVARRIADRQSINECVISESKDEVGVLVSAFNRMLEQLGERQSRLEESQRLAHLGNWSFDLDRNRFEFSEEAFRILGLRPSDPPLDYSAFSNRIHRDDLRVLERAILLTRQERKSHAADFKLTRQDGSLQWIHLTSAWFKDADDRAVLRGIIMDITDRKQSEAALLQGQKLESLGVLAGGIAHDFNNLLAALRTNLDLASTDLSPDSPAGRHVAKSEKIIERAANLTRQLLAYSGKGQFQVKPLDITQQVREMGHLLSVSVSKKAELRYQVMEGLPAIIGDTSQIQQVIMNLVINASEALEEHGGYVLIRTGVEYLESDSLKDTYAGQGLSPGPYVVLEVQDNGHGMDARVLERIFDPFFTTKFHGRGLGLAAMLGIVKSHHGGIKVYSEVGRGTLFKVLFPSSNTFLKKHESMDPTASFSRSGRILVVDDEPDIRQASSDIFEHLGFEVLLAADGMEGLERVKEHLGNIQLILLDLTMPRMNGIECLKEIRAIDPEVPVIMTSGFSENESMNELAGLKYSSFLQKPYSLSSLKAKIREILG